MMPAMPGTVPFAVLIRVSFLFAAGPVGCFPARDGGDLEDGWDEGLAIEMDPICVGEVRKAR